MDKLPLQYFQTVLLEKAFSEVKISVKAIQNFLMALLSDPYSMHSSLMEKVSLEPELLKRRIAEGGSATFNQLITILREEEEFGDPELLRVLTDHSVKQVYRYVWIWSEDLKVVRRGKAWYTDEKLCRADGIKDRPPFNTRNGPIATLCVESCCTCYLHYVDERRYNVIGLPCRCFVEVITTPVKKDTGIRLPSRSTPWAKPLKKRLFESY